ncbi:MAG: M42 family peptidase [Ruminococcus sp.]|nr:M42 family peptidase [Ruminococcus sp.]
MDNEKIYEILKSLSEAEGIAGNERAVTTRIESFFSPERIIKRGGSLLVSLASPREDRENLLVDAHIDRIGFRVTYITDGGFLKIGAVGGIDTRVLPAAEVTVIGKNGAINGVICTKPPHLSGGDSEKKSVKVEDFAVDVGMDKAAAEAAIPLGSAVYLTNTCEKMLGDRVTGAAFDNRAGAAVLLAALPDINSENCKYNVYYLFSEGEEVNERGAKTAPFGIDFARAIIVDTSFARGNGEDEHKSGRLGGGVMIGVSSTLDGDFSSEMTDLAKEREIPFQIEVMPEKTGTNADEIGTLAGGVKTVTLSFPIRSMHTAVESLSLSDINAAARLIAAYVKGEKA